MQQKKFHEQQCGDNWDVLLQEFHKIEANPTKDQKSKLEKLKEKAKNTAELTARQREGIIDRCNNVINGTYGNTKKGIEFKGA